MKVASLGFIFSNLHQTILKTDNIFFEKHLFSKTQVLSNFYHQCSVFHNSDEKKLPQKLGTCQ